MKESAAELIAQIIVGLLIVSAIEIRAILNSGFGAPNKETPRFVFAVAMSYISSIVLTVLSLIICINSVIADRPIGTIPTYYIRFTILLQVTAVALVPAVNYGFEAWEKNFPNREEENWYLDSI